jgi:hypothetical protein
VTVGVPIVGVCFEKDTANVNRKANSVPKPTPVIYEPTPSIEAGNRVDKHLENETGMLRMPWECARPSMSKPREVVIDIATTVKMRYFPSS